jgi:hypothetical protein
LEQVKKQLRTTLGTRHGEERSDAAIQTVVPFPKTPKPTEKPSEASRDVPMSAVPGDPPVAHRENFSR